MIGSKFQPKVTKICFKVAAMASLLVALSSRGGAQIAESDVIDGGALLSSRFAAKAVARSLWPAAAPDEDALAPNACATLGEQRVAVVVVNVEDFEFLKDPTIRLRDIFFSTTQPSLANFVEEASYGAAWVTGDVFGPLQVPAEYRVAGTIDPAPTIDAADEKYNLSDYDYVILAVPTQADRSGARGVLGVGCSSRIPGFVPSIILPLNDRFHQRQDELGKAIHEFGHNLGLQHDNFLRFEEGTLGPPTIAGTDEEYGGRISIMGSSGFRAGLHFSAPHKSLLGWLAPQSPHAVTVVSTSGVHELLALESQEQGVKALRVQRGSGQYVWIEYRRPLGKHVPADFLKFVEANSLSLDSGASMHLESLPGASRSDTHTYMLAPSVKPFDYATRSYYDQVLPGEEWNDAFSNLSFKVLAADNERLTIEVSYGPCERGVSPAFGVLSGSGGRAAVEIGAAEGCVWRSTAHDDWIRFPDGSTGMGAASLEFLVDPNPTQKARVGSIEVNGDWLLVEQAGGAVALASPAITHGASFDSRVGVAATSISSIFGTFDGVKTLEAGKIPLPTKLVGVEVLVDGVPAPLFFVSGTQINIQMPDLPVQGPAERHASLKVVTQEGTALAEPYITIRRAVPGLFEWGDHYAVAVNADGTLNGPENPAGTGSIVLLYLTGIGSSSSMGSRAPVGAVNPADRVYPSKYSAAAWIGGKRVNVEFIGLAPNWVGLAQANVRAPLDRQGRLEVVVQVDGVFTGKQDGNRWLPGRPPAIFVE